MAKTSLKLTSKVLTGVVLLSGVSSLPANAVEVSSAKVDVNKKDVAVKVVKEQGQYYAELTSSKAVTNVVAKVKVDGKEYKFKQGSLEANKPVKIKVDMAKVVAQPTKKLPNTASVKETIKTTEEIDGHSFEVIVTYDVEKEISTEETKEVKEEKTLANIVPVVKEVASSFRTVATPTLSYVKDVAVEAAKNLVVTKEETKEEKTLADIVPTDNKTNETAVTEKPVVEEKTASKEVALETKVENSTTETKKDVKAEIATKVEEAKVASKESNQVVTPKATNVETKEETQKQAVSTETTVTPVKTETVKQDTTKVAKTFAEQVAEAYKNKVNTLRAMNGLSTLGNNLHLDNSAQKRANVEQAALITGTVHGVGGSKEKTAAAEAGYTGKILYNVAQESYSANETAEQVADKLISRLYFEKNNVTPSNPYGHRNTLLNSTATVHGVGIAINNGIVTLVQHVGYTGGWNGTNAGSTKYLDGKVYTK